MAFASCCHVGAAEPSTLRCVGQLVMTPASTGRGDKSRPVVCTGGSWRSFARSFSDEPEIEANQKQGEMYEAAIKQEGVIAENPKKGNGTLIAKPRKIPARPGRNKADRCL
jgi:hypothetical protein